MLSQLTLANFRNYDFCQVNFSPGLNGIIGDNGQGKTNLLEAVYYLSLLRSFRTNDVNDIRQCGKNSFHVTGIIPSEVGPNTRLSVLYGAERKLSINGMNVYKASDFINQFVCVTFIPQDMSLVQGTPILRRRFLDIAISQGKPEYLRHLQAYQQALHSRNAMLKNCEKYTRPTITAFDCVLAREGAEIEVTRNSFLKQINERLLLLSPLLLEDQRIISAKYMTKINFLLQEIDKSKEEIEQEYLKAFEKTFESDVKRQATSIGPHRSDFKCLLDGVAMENYASQGECRIASLALKLACLELVEQQVGKENVTLLIDDVIGELDRHRRSCFFNVINDIGQALVACTEISDGLRLPDKMFYIKNGTVLEQMR